MLNLTELEAEIAGTESVVASADALMDRLFAEFEANKNDPAAVQALVDRARAAKQALAASVAENTPAAAPPAA
jgi:hypothetical protein